MLTDAVRKALGTIDVSLQEYVIVSDNGFYSYRKNGYFNIDLERQKEVDDND
jgi:DNA repair protein RadC